MKIPQDIVERKMYSNSFVNISIDTVSSSGFFKKLLLTPNLRKFGEKAALRVVNNSNVAAVTNSGGADVSNFLVPKLAANANK